jgi:hypothetical protein
MPDMNPDRAGAVGAPANPGAGCGARLRCIGAAVPGAVRVLGGAEYVKPPRLPMDDPPPARAKASPGASARTTARTRVSERDGRMVSPPECRRYGDAPRPIREEYGTMCRAIPVARQDLPGSRDADRRNSPGSPLAPRLQCHRADDEQECRIMSISALASTPWSPPTPSSTDAGAASAINWPSPQWTTGSITQGTNDLVQSGTASASNPFQQLSGDIQALLVQAQSGSGSGTTTAPTTATATPTTLTPTQQLAADVQTILSELQGSGSSGATATQAGTPQASAAGQAQPHHHHHHHESGADTTSATAATGTATSTGTTPAAPSSSSASSADAAVSNVFAADIVQALQSYGSTSSSASSIGLTA